MVGHRPGAVARGRVRGCSWASSRSPIAWRPSSGIDVFRLGPPLEVRGRGKVARWTSPPDAEGSRYFEVGRSYSPPPRDRTNLQGPLDTALAVPPPLPRCPVLLPTCSTTLSPEPSENDPRRSIPRLCGEIGLRYMSSQLNLSDAPRRPISLARPVINLRSPQTARRDGAGSLSPAHPPRPWQPYASIFPRITSVGRGDQSGHFGTGLRSDTLPGRPRPSR